MSLYPFSSKYILLQFQHKNKNPLYPNMFSKYRVNPSMAQYIREQTNKSLEKYYNKQQRVVKMDDDTNTNPSSNLNYAFFTTFAFFSIFLALRVSKRIQV